MKLKKTLKIVGITMLALLLLAVVVGVLDALVGGGKWHFGWTDYRYDDTGYEVGEGSVIADGITTIDVDWIDGSVEVVLCQDRYISLTEKCDEMLTEEGKLHYRVSDDGKTLSVKYRASSWYLGSSKNKEKTLILRIPERMVDPAYLLENELQPLNIKIKTVSGDVYVDATPITRPNEGDQPLSMVMNTLRVETKSGDVHLLLAKNSSFSLKFDSRRDETPAIGFDCTKKNGRYVCGDGDMKITVITKKGALSVNPIK